MVGIVQEQHPHRAALFMQWKRMDWPVLVDALNRLEVAVVPITLLIDEHGVIREVARRPSAEQMEAFLADWAPPAPPPREPARPDLEPRRRYDSPRRRDGDFQAAADAWATALALDPNQYIWRRRIQQYGPRLDKPYPFYDWVAEARAAIEARGETPVALAVEPSGAELARPQRHFDASADAGPGPDPDGRIERDARGYIRVETTVVPHTSSDGTARVHLALRPDAALDAHWNNEAEPLVLWLEPPRGWAVSGRRRELANPTAAVSTETRRLEFEVTPGGMAMRPARVRAYLLYNVCEGAAGRCLDRRQDVEIILPAPARPRPAVPSSPPGSE
jgi:hypothetical protein